MPQELYGIQSLSIAEGLCVLGSSRGLENEAMVPPPNEIKSVIVKSHCAAVTRSVSNIYYLLLDFDPTF